MVLVFNATGSDVRTVLVGGRVVVEEGRLTIDEAQLPADCQARADQLRERFLARAAKVQ